MYNVTRYEQVFGDFSYSDYDMPYPYNVILIGGYVPLILFLLATRNYTLKIMWALFNLGLAVYSYYVFMAAQDIVLYGAGLNDVFKANSKEIVGTFLLSKYVELADTVFILLDNKNPTFLHWFHHLVTLVFTRMNYQYMTKTSIYFVFMNAFVHTIMYAYYFFTCIGYRFKWKSLITKLQIAQMFGGMGVLSWNAYVGDENMPVVYSGLAMYTFYAFLFIKFYVRTYSSRTHN